MMMKKLILSLLVLVLALGAGTTFAQVVVNPGWEVFVIREGSTLPPTILDNDAFQNNSIEFGIFETGQKAGLATNLINGATVSNISTLHVDRLDDYNNSGSIYGPYFNIWVSDGLGNYAVIANEPSDAEWASSRWDVADWDYLKTKRCKVYETTGATGGNPGTSWVATYLPVSGDPLTFEDVADLIIAPPSPAYIAAGNGVGSGAPDEITTNIAYGFTWVFGDTQSNYVNGDGYVVNNYSATATFPVQNVTQVTSYATISAALADAVDGDDITVDAGTYSENLVIPVGVTLRSLSGAATTTIAGSGGEAISITADNVEIDGFTITNPTGVRAIAATDYSHLFIHDNVITNIGSSTLASYVHSIAIVCSASPVDDVVIKDNDFINIEAGEYSSASAITVGWSNGDEIVTGLVIQGNNISHVRSNTSAWNVGHGAYGILLNHGTGTTGKIVGAQIINNTIDDLEGLWSHGIGLEGNTPGAIVTGNSISNLVDHKLPSDAVAIMVEANAGLGSVTISSNVFTNVPVGIVNLVGGPEFVNAINNDWGDSSGPYNPNQNPAAVGAAVTGYVQYTPWIGRTVDLIADLGIDPTSRTMAVDGYGYWEGTPSMGVDDDYVLGFGPGSHQANVTAADPVKYTKYGFVPSVVFGRDIQMGELYSITYHTKKDTDHIIDPADWFCQMYTNGTAHGWYGERINSEPYFSENLTETPGQWTKWDTEAGQNNRLRFFDSNINFGSYTDGFLQDMTNDPAFTDQTIMLFGLGTGSAWAEGFDGKLDGLTVELINGEKVTFNFISGNALANVTPSTSGPLMCSGQPDTLVFSLTLDDYTADVFGFSAVVRTTSEMAFDTVTSLDAFGATTQFFSFDQGDGSFLISGTTQGSPTQPISGAGSTDLFSIIFTTVSEGTAQITFDSFTVRDPANQPIPATAEGASILVDCSAPVAVTDIDAQPHHNKVTVTWTHDGLDTDHYEIYRGLWYDVNIGDSAYPEYDDLAGDVIPTRGADRTAVQGNAEWMLAGIVPAGTFSFDDAWGNADDRGVYYYEVFAVDAAAPVGNNTLAAAANDRATNYWLGDMNENGAVAVYDMSVLGSAFGTSELVGGDYNAYADVGPTDDWSRVGIPNTDNYVNFEDLMVFSMNFGIVSDSNKSDIAISTKADLSWVRYDEGTYALRLNDASGLKGVHLRADLPEGASVTVTEGDLLDQQTEMTFLRNIGEDLDVSLAITGVDNGFMGQGDLFIVECTEELAMEDIVIDLRGSDNSRIEVSLDSEVGTLTPRVFGLNAAYPNPFNPMTKISFSLPESQDVRLNVYGIDGKLVTTLVNETRGAGLHEVIWNGQNNSGQVQASGLYFYRIEAGPYSQVRKMTLMK